MEKTTKSKRNINPRETANLFTKLSFLDTLKIFHKGFKRELTEDDLYDVIPSYDSQKLGDRIEQEWEKQMLQPKPSFLSVLWKLFGKRYILLGLTQLFLIVLNVGRPMVIGKLVSYFVPGQTEITKTQAWIFGCLLILLNFAASIYNQNYSLQVWASAVQTRAAVISLIYRKSLLLSFKDLQAISMGKITTLITKDVATFEVFFQLFNNLWTGLITTAILCYNLYRRIGLPFVIVIVAFLIVLAIQIFLGSIIVKLKLKTTKKTDERLKATQEVLSTIRSIKMYVWEKYFHKKVFLARKKELRFLHRMYFVLFIKITLSYLTQPILFYLLVMTCVWLGFNMTAENIYFIISCLQSMSFTLVICIPYGIFSTAETIAAVMRIEHILKKIDAKNNKCSEIEDKKLFSIDARNVCKPQNGLTVIAGPTGGGKTLFLINILNESKAKQDRLSYASQTPWLFPSTIRQNIIYNNQYDPNRYDHVLRDCALKLDLESFDSGDQTIISDQGINLSRGQQARVNLARAIYKDSDIYLIDDIFSSLDPVVCDFIMKECIAKLSTKKTVILVSNNDKIKKFASKIINIDNSMITEKEEHIRKISVDCDRKDFSEALLKSEEDDEEPSVRSKLLVINNNCQKNIYEENKESGAVTIQTYKKLINLGGGLWFFGFVLLIFTAAQLFTSYKDKLVGDWANLEEQITSSNKNDTINYNDLVNLRTHTIYIYTGVTIAIGVTYLGRMFFLFLFFRFASTNLHKLMFTSVLKATMKFFDINFIGNILNRFSKDLTIVDENIPPTVQQITTILLETLGMIVLIAFVNVTFLIPTVIIFFLFYLLRHGFLKTARNLKRLEATTKNPVVGYLNTTLEGLNIVKAFNAEEISKNQFDQHQNPYTSASYIHICCIKAFSFSIDILSVLLMAVVIIRFLILDKGISAGDVGLTISQVFAMSGSLHWGIHKWAELETFMTSTERIFEYTNVKQETKTGTELTNWPSKGLLEFERVYLTVNEKKTFLLKNFNFVINPREKIGIVGRTGAGKSSLVSVLFRLYEIEGRIRIDGVDIKTLALDFLRSHISVIPQDPILIVGTIRDNLDPEGKHTDEEIWDIIKIVHLNNTIVSLDHQVSDLDFTTGQKQLICLARILSQQNKIVVLDEATENVDSQTEELINEIVERHFEFRTVIKIAHKLQFVRKCDKIFVVDKAEIVEVGSPFDLVQKKEGLFYEMLEKSGLHPEEYCL